MTQGVAPPESRWGGPRVRMTEPFMKPEGLTPRDGVVLIRMQRKAAENNRLFGGTGWTPRKIDKVVWTYGR